MAKNKQAEEQLSAAQQVMQDFNTDYWPVDGEVDDTDRAPVVTEDGRPRLYWHLEPGATLHGLYKGTEVLTMPKYGTTDVMEERAFAVFEIANPPGYKGEAPYAVKVRRPRSDKIEFAVVGDVVHVGIRSRLTNLCLLSALNYQTLVGLRAIGQDKTAKGFKLWGFEKRFWTTDQPALRTLAEKIGQAGAPNDQAMAALFAVQDRGLYAARNLFKMVIPMALLELTENQSGVIPQLEPAPEQKQIAAQASTPAQ